MNNSNATVLRWNTSLNMAEYQRGYDYGGRLGCLPVEVNQLPPFQLPNTNTGASITSFSLVHFETGTTTDVTAAIATAGLTVSTYVGKSYDLIIYPANTPLAISPLPLGAYYAVMSDGTNTWYSELFTMVSSVSEMVQISWCHQEDFEYSGGHIDYQNNYQNYIYVKSDILAPTYEYEEEVISRDGYNYAEKQVSYKMFKMWAFLSESVIDALRLARLHDTVTITNNNDGRVYSANEFLLTDVEWLNTAHLAHLALEFKTDTVVVINGRAVVEADCGIGSGGGTGSGPVPCVTVGFECEAAILTGSAEYLGEYYTPSGGGANVPFQEGDYIIVQTGAGFNEFNLYQYLSGAYSAVTGTAQNVIAFDANENRYYWQAVNPTGNIWRVTRISAYTNKDNTGAVTSSPRLWTAIGRALPGTTVEVFTYDALGNETLAGIGTATELDAPGIEFTWTAAAVGIRAKISTPTCRRFDATEDVDFEGVNYWEIPTTNEVQ